MIMTSKKTLSPLAMGALTLTLGMSLVNNANASLIVGDTTDTVTFASDILVDAAAEENIFDFGNEFFGEDSAEIAVNVGDLNTAIFVTDFINNFSGSLFRDGRLQSDNNDLLFSVSNCGISDCLNRFAAGDVIDESLFDGTLGDSSGFGALYLQDPDSGSEETFGNWGEVGDTGFVAFAYNLESVDVQFGFLEITRGSISINQGVIQSVTTSTSVPEPASLLLLGAGLFGLASRKKLKA
jgi:hypothetical protein